MGQPLTGIRVLDLSRLLPGPFLTMALADLGAEVIKVESPGLGDYLRVIPPLLGQMSGRFHAVNRGKRSVVLDLKDAVARDALLRMVAGSDVVVESFRPGVMARLGLSYDDLERVRPGIILCSISGYGQDGPYRERAGHDLNYIGTAGVLAMGGERNGPPALPGAQIADLSGALWGLSAVLGALVGRERGHGGAHLDISMTEGALALLAAEIGNLDCPGQPPSRGTATLNGGMACYSVYRTKDSRYLSVGALEPKFWSAFNAAIGRTPRGDDLISAEAQEGIAAELQAIIETKTSEEWMRVFGEVDCCTDAVLELDELGGHPLHRERGVFFTTQTQDGASTQVRLPVGEPSAQRSAPRHGEHTSEVLAELGFTDEEIAALS